MENNFENKNEKTDIAMLAEALQISQSELEEKVKNLYADYKETTKPVRFFDRKRFTTIGLVIMAMAVIGLFWTIFNGVVLVKDFFKPDYDKYSSLIEPTIISDISAFENTSEISNNQILTVAVWEIILHGDTENYSKSFDLVFVPKNDVEKAAAKIFGNLNPITHQTIKIGNHDILFNEAKQQYVIPLKPDYFSYYSKIEKVSENKNGSVSIVVALYSDTPKWQENLKLVKKTPVKYLRYTITSNKITAVKNISADYGITSDF
jgi:hypothetical protein